MRFESRPRPLDLGSDAVTTNIQIRARLRNVANWRVHATTGRVLPELLVEKWGALLP